MTRPDYDPYRGDGAENVPWPYISGVERQLRPASVVALFGFGLLTGAVLVFTVIPWLVEWGVG